MIQIEPPSDNVKWSILRLLHDARSPEQHGNEGTNAVKWLSQFGPWVCSECQAEREMHEIEAYSHDGSWKRCRGECQEIPDE